MLTTQGSYVSFCGVDGHATDVCLSPNADASVSQTPSAQKSFMARPS